MLEGGSGCLPAALYRLLDPAAPVELPPPGSVAALREGANRELDKLVAALGRSKATWRRALALHEWLLQVRDARRRAGQRRQAGWCRGRATACVCLSVDTCQTV